MDAYVKEIPVAREATSEQAFGAASLQPPDGTDLVPSGIFFRDPGLRPEQQHLLREAYARLLGDGAFPRVLDLLASSDDFVPRAAGLRLTGLAPPTRVAADLRPRSGVACEVTHDVNEQPRLPFDDASFDAVLSCGVLEHVPYEEGSVREIARVLKPGGHFFVYQLPN